MLSRKQYRRDSRRASDASLLNAMRLYRARKAYADRIATIEYHLHKRRESIQDAPIQDDVQDIHDSILAENQWQRKCDEYRRLRYTMRRLVTFAEQARMRDLNTEFAELVNALPVRLPGTVTPAIVPIAGPPKPPLPSMVDSLGEQLAGLIDRLAPQYRLDVAAQAACVRSQYPDATPSQIFARARTICRHVRQGRFCRDDQTTASALRERQSNAYAHADSQAMADHLESIVCSRHDLTAERLALVEQTLDPVVRDGLKRGWTQVMIAEFTGLSPATITRRIQAIREVASAE